MPRSATAAIIHWASDPVSPGEIALIIGDNFGEAPRVIVRRLDDTDEQKSIVNFVRPKVLRNTTQSIAIEMPNSFRPGIFEVRIENGSEKHSILLNEPDISWAQGDQGITASPGGWLRVFGRNVRAPGQHPRLLLRLNELEWLLHSSESDRWNATYKLPKDLPNGSFDLFVHNGWGGTSAWQPAGSIAVKAPVRWPSRSFDVRDFGALGDGKVDDMAAVKRTILAAQSNGGGVVHFPRGRFRLSEELVIPPRVRLVGAGRDLSALAFVDFKVPPAALISGEGHFAIEKLTIYAANHRVIIKDTSHPGGTVGPGNVRLSKLRIRANIFRGYLRPEGLKSFWKTHGTRVYRPDLVAISLGGDNIQILDNDIAGSFGSLALYSPRGAHIARNRIANGRYGSFRFSGPDKLVFEKNEVVGADLMATGGSIATGHTEREAKHVFVGSNRFHNLLGWDREALTTDGGGGVYFGRIVSRSDRSIELLDHFEEPLSSAEMSWAQLSLYILSGPGRGQMAKILKRSGNILTLDKQLHPRPDAASLVTITWRQSNFLIVGNHFEESSWATAFAGVSYNHIVADNVATRNSGFVANGRWYRHFQPSWYCQFLNNEIRDGNGYRAGNGSGFDASEAVIALRGRAKRGHAVPLLLGGIIRNNRLLANAHIEVTGGQQQSPSTVGEVVVEGNIVGQSSIVLKRDPGAGKIIERHNHRPNDKKNKTSR